MKVQNPYASWPKDSVEEWLVRKWISLNQLRRMLRKGSQSTRLEGMIADCEFGIILLQECL